MSSNFRLLQIVMIIFRSFQSSTQIYDVSAKFVDSCDDAAAVSIIGVGKMGAPTVSNFQILCEWLSDSISLLVVLVTNHGSLRVYRGMTIFNDNSLATICCTSLKVTFRGLRRFVSIPPLHLRSICDTPVGVIDGREGR